MNGIYRFEQGDDFVMIAGGVRVDDMRQPLLLDGLPDLWHLRGTIPDAAALGWLLQRSAREMRADARPGSAAMLAHLAQLL